MLQRSSERVRTGFVLTLLICAVLVRFILACGVSASTQTEVETGTQTVSEPEATPVEQRTNLRPTLSARVEEPAEEPVQDTGAPEAEQLNFTEADAAAIRVTGGCSYEVDVLAALQTEWLSEPEGEPTVLIVHTHGTEAYTAEAGWEYAGQEGYRTEQADYSVVRVGRALKARLEELGIRVIHDETMYDQASFSGAYAASRQAVQNWLEQDQSICMVIDLHRDAAENPDGTAFAPTVTLDGEDCARLMLVVGTDEGGLTHPQWRKNFACAVQLQALLNRSAPGLCRDVDLRTERFNQHLSTGALLIEVGAAGNTLRQALSSAQLLAEGIARLLAGTTGE